MALALANRFSAHWWSRSGRLVNCWKMTRTDGAIIRMTDADQPVWILSEEYRPMAQDTPGDVLANRGGAESYAMQHRSGLAESSSAIDGLVSSDEITLFDLLNQKYEGARVEHRIVDALLPEAGELLRVFRIMQTATDNSGRWRAELITEVSAALGEKRGDVVTGDCRNQVFDDQCGRAKTTGGADELRREEWIAGVDSSARCTVRAVVDERTLDVAIPSATIDILTGVPSLGGYTYFQTLTPHWLAGTAPEIGRPINRRVGVRGNVGSVPDVNGTYTAMEPAASSPSVDLITFEIVLTTSGSTLGTVGLEPPENFYERGILTWYVGGNAGLLQVVESSADFTLDVVAGSNGYVRIVLESTPPRAVQVGDQLSLTAGCNGTAEVCTGTFDNIVNMRAEPTVTDVFETLRTPDIR